MTHQNQMTCPIKLERIKRSWTQEYLAQMSGVSVRTIQRLERGEEVNAETLRLIANAMAIDVETLRSPSIRLNYSASWSKKLKIMTWSVVAFLVIDGVITLFFIPPVSFVSLIIILSCMAYSVQGYSLKDNKLYIHRLGWSRVYPLSSLKKTEVNPHATMGSIRLFGIGGIFSNIGLYRNDILGNYHAYITDSHNALILTFLYKTIVITPDDPNAMGIAIERILEGSEEGKPHPTKP